jgi:sorbitol/mannitol transport system substrate-binding protein
MHDPANGVYGVCLRGKPGWGDNMGFITTLANTFGAQLFGMDWKPQFDSPEWKQAINYYVDLMNKYGPPGSTANSFNEILALINEGKCGAWIDATIAASFVSDPSQSKVADVIAYAQAPTQKTKRGANWLWAWALGIPASSEKKDASMKFLEWSTSKDYINLVGETNGWGRVPTGTRTSTYANEKFQAAANFADAELDAIFSANPYDSTFEKTPYTGVQFAAIPEFQAIGTAAGQQFAAALAGEKSVEEALAAAQAAADREMRKGRYY